MQTRREIRDTERSLYAVRKKHRDSLSCELSGCGVEVRANIYWRYIVIVVMSPYSLPATVIMLYRCCPWQGQNCIKCVIGIRLDQIKAQLQGLFIALLNCRWSAVSWPYRAVSHVTVHCLVTFWCQLTAYKSDKAVNLTWGQLRLNSIQMYTSFDHKERPLILGILVNTTPIFKSTRCLLLFVWPRCESWSNV